MKIKVVVLLIAVIFLSIFFYWKYIRPSTIRQSCIKQVEDAPGEWRGWSGMKERANDDYRVCLIKNGMAPETILVNIE